jgi:hypothetical protein
MEFKVKHKRGALAISDRAYYTKRSQKDGERDLSRLARTANREDAWVFYEDSGLWMHLPTKPYRRSTREGDLVVGVECPAVYKSDLGNVPIPYHIHPDFFVNNLVERLGAAAPPEDKEAAREVAYAWFSMPSNNDLSIVTGKGRGYEHRITTARGTTALKANHTEIPIQVCDAERLFRDCIDPRILNERGFETGMKDAMNKANNLFGQQLEVSFHLN